MQSGTVQVLTSSGRFQTRAEPASGFFHRSDNHGKAFKSVCMLLGDRPDRYFKGICSSMSKHFMVSEYGTEYGVEFRLFDPGLIMVLGIGLIQK